MAGGAQRVDELLLNNARAHGVAVHEGVRVAEVLFEGSRAKGVRVGTGDGVYRDVYAAVTVDASGRAALLQHPLKLRLWDPVLNKAAIWIY